MAESKSSTSSTTTTPKTTESKVEEKDPKTFPPKDTPDEIREGHDEGSGSWWSDPDATDPAGSNE